jgi:transcriptional regulator with XRE-family HTH domain
MNRKSSDRFSAKTIEQGKTTMFAVEVFSPQDADQMARKMIEKVSRGNGDQMNAYEKVAERCGMSARQLRRFLSGEIKNPGFRLMEGIRVGWIRLWMAEVNKLQRELEEQKARFGSEHFMDLEAEIQTLDQKLEIAMQRAKQGR